MEIEKKEQIFFYLKLLLCTSLIAVWISCLTMYPEPKTPKAIKTANKIKKPHVQKHEEIESIQYGSVKLDSNKIVLSTKKSEKLAEPKPVIKKQENQKPAQVAKTIEAKNQIKKQSLQAKTVATPKPDVKQLKPIKPSQVVVKSDVSKEIHLANKVEVKNALKNGWQGEKVIKNIKEAVKQNDKVTVNQKQASGNDTLKDAKEKIDKADQKTAIIQKPVTNSVVKEEEKSIVLEEPSGKNNLAELNFVNLNFPSVAGATRKVLEVNKEPVKEKIEKADLPSQLRREIPVEKSSVMALQQLAIVKPVKQDEWVPRYLAIEKKQLEKKVDTLSDNLEKISNQIEVTGFVDNQDGQKSVIIRNTLSNKVEILNKGEKYQGILRVLDVNNNEVLLGNEELKKTYVKRMAPVE